MKRCPVSSDAVVTGACGFVGRALVDCLLQKGQRVIAVDRPGREERLPASDRLQFIGAISELSGLQADVFYHLAWHGSAGEARSDIWAQEANICFTLEAVEQAARMGCKRFVFAGSISELEIRKKRRQTDRIDPWDGYAFAKSCADDLGRCLAKKLGIDYMTGCITNAYGIGERSERLICRTLQAIREGKEVFFTEGKQFYDFIYITDAAQAFAAIGQRGKAGKSYLVGSGHPRPLRAWMEELLEVSGGKGRFGAVPFTSARLEEADLSTTELETDTGFSCQIPFSAGIRKTMSWMEEDDVRFSF